MPFGLSAPRDVGCQGPADPGRCIAFSGCPEVRCVCTKPIVAPTYRRQHASGRGTCLARGSPQSYGWVRRPGAPCGVTRQGDRPDSPSGLVTARQASRPVSRTGRPGPMVVQKCRRSVLDIVVRRPQPEGCLSSSHAVSWTSRRPVSANGHRSSRIDRLARPGTIPTVSGAVSSLPSSAVRGHEPPGTLRTLPREETLDAAATLPRSAGSVARPPVGTGGVMALITLAACGPTSDRSEDRPSAGARGEAANSPSRV